MVSLGSAPSRRRALGWTAGLAGLAGGLAGWRAVAGGEPPLNGEVVLTTGVTSGVYAQYGQLLRSQLSRDLPQLTVSLRTSQGSVENLRRLAAGQADFAIVTADSAASYLDQRLPRHDDLRACARLYDDYMQLIVPARSAVRRPGELTGLRVGVGQDESGVQLVTRELLASAGLDLDSDVEAVRESIQSMPRMLEAGRLDAFFWSGGLPTRAVEQLTERVAVRLVPLDGLRAPLRERGGPARHYRSAVIPRDAYPAAGAPSATGTVAVANLLVTMASTGQRQTQEITASVIRGRDRIGQVVHAAQWVDLRTAIYTRPLALHPGAERYYRSVKT